MHKSASANYFTLSQTTSPPIYDWPSSYRDGVAKQKSGNKEFLRSPSFERSGNEGLISHRLRRFVEY